MQETLSRSTILQYTKLEQRVCLPRLFARLLVFFSKSAHNFDFLVPKGVRVQLPPSAP